MIDTNASATPSALQRYRRFLRKPWGEKKQSIAFRYLRAIPHAFLPLRLPIGAWWFAENDFIGTALLCDAFEKAECALVRRIIRPGMTVLDIGAHKGFYSLVFSRLVGAQGRVLSFEPSRRERFRLKLHLRVNSCRNVEVFDFALGPGEESGQLFVVEGAETGLNSLRPPSESVPTHRETIRIRPLDAVLEEKRVNQVDFIKIDVEGGELGVFSGAEYLLKRVPRPFVLAEVSDMRAEPWGHRADDLLSLFERINFRWFAIGTDGKLLAVERQKAFYDNNFLAVPEERNGDVFNLV